MSSVDPHKKKAVPDSGGCSEAHEVARRLRSLLRRTRVTRSGGSGRSGRSSRSSRSSRSDKCQRHRTICVDTSPAQLVIAAADGELRAAAQGIPRRRMETLSYRAMPGGARAIAPGEDLCATIVRRLT